MVEITEDELLNTEFEKAQRVHDWRNHIGENTRQLWKTFTHAQRLGLMRDADEEAGREEWD